MTEFGQSFRDIRSSVIKFKSLHKDMLKYIEDQNNFYYEREKTFQNYKKSEQIVILNIGGKKYHIKLYNLLRKKDSLFYGLIKKFILKKYDFIKNGIFIDRNYKYFHYVFNYMLYDDDTEEDCKWSEKMLIREELYFYNFVDSVEIAEECVADIFEEENINY
jgi:hypothetical protein